MENPADQPKNLETRRPEDDAEGIGARASGFLNAHLCLVLTAGVWIVGLAGAYWVSIVGLLQGEGASLLLVFVVLPAILVCWLTGGPIALLVGRNSLRQVAVGDRPQSDMRLARTGIGMGRAMNIVVLALVVLAGDPRLFREETESARDYLMLGKMRRNTHQH